MTPAPDTHLASRQFWLPGCSLPRQRLKSVLAYCHIPRFALFDFDRRVQLKPAVDHVTTPVWPFDHHDYNGGRICESTRHEALLQQEESQPDLIIAVESRTRERGSNHDMNLQAPQTTGQCRRQRRKLAARKSELFLHQCLCILVRVGQQDVVHNSSSG